MRALFGCWSCAAAVQCVCQSYGPTDSYSSYYNSYYDSHYDSYWTRAEQTISTDTAQATDPGTDGARHH